MKVTISDVARLAGVSTATVSHTINNTRYVSNETKEKVYQAIAELGYTPDASARSFRTGRKRTIGFIVPDISNQFFATLVETLEEYLSNRVFAGLLGEELKPESADVADFDAYLRRYVAALPVERAAVESV